MEGCGIFHYIVKVPSSGESLTAKETVLNRLEYFNSRCHYLLFDSGSETEKRFIMVSDKKLTKSITTELKNIFEIPVTAEAIDVKAIDRKTLKKIHIAKMLMHDDNYNYSGEQTTILVTDSAEGIIEKVDSMLGAAKYKEFFKGFSDYIDRSAGMMAKALYNTVFINRCGVCLDNHVELLYGLLAVKGLLTEHVMIAGNKWEAKNTEKETRFLYYVRDDWRTDDGEEFLRASDEVKLFNKIRRSDNVYVTAMTQGQYDKLSALDCFTAAFPNTVTIDELTADEKLEYICSIAEEYGFAVNKDGFSESRFINITSVEKIELAVRNAVIRKLNANDKTFRLEISDIATKIKSMKKVSAFDELEGLIGLNGVKETIREIVTFLKRRGKDAMPCLHMCFTGNPGTGKTTVARIIARIFYEAGIIKKNILVETDRGGLIGLYVGHTADKTARKIESAEGGILFIDEAYSLFVNDNIDYGHEAVATLVKAMEDKRDEFVCILAGYTKEMNDMINMNPGLKDRIQFYVDFPDYDESELLQIFSKLCKDNKYRLSDSAKDTLLTGFTRIINRKSQNFSNARLARKVFERVRIKQALRTSGGTISDADIKAVLSEKDIAELLRGSNRIQIGFKAIS
jgi:AAA+ superfamily predicted ATPase